MVTSHSVTLPDLREISARRFAPTRAIISLCEPAPPARRNAPAGSRHHPISSPSDLPPPGSTSSLSVASELSHLFAHHSVRLSCLPPPSRPLASYASPRLTTPISLPGPSSLAAASPALATDHHLNLLPYSTLCCEFNSPIFELRASDNARKLPYSVFWADHCFSPETLG